MSLPDTVFIFALALVIFGPKKLPEIGRQIGKLVYEFRRASNEFKLQIEEELRSAEEADRQKQFAAQSSSLPAASVVSSEMSPDSSEASESFGALTVHPPSTGTQVSADSPSHSYSSEGEDEEDWNSWNGDEETATSQAQDTEETVQEGALEPALEQSPTPALESSSEPGLEQSQEQSREQAQVETREQVPEPAQELNPEPTLEEIFEQSEFPEQGLELIREEPPSPALAHSIEQPLEHAQEQATNHHG